jgi:ribosome-associated protein
MNNNLLQDIINILQQQKAAKITTLDIAQLTDMADFMLICSGTSTAHVRGISRKIARELKIPGEPKVHMEGEDASQWVLIDLGDIIVNVMTEEMRDFYQLEELWGK